MIKLPSYWQQQFRHEDGWLFKGTLQPIVDMKIYNDDYYPVRQIMRVDTSTMPIMAGIVVTSPVGEQLLLGEYDRRSEYHGFRVYPCNMQVRWTRTVDVVDPLTGLPKSTSVEDLGHIWVVSEVVSREARGGNIKTREEVRRILTGADVQLNDVLDGMVVVKVNHALGINVLEVQ